MKNILLVCAIFITGCPKKETPELKTNNYENANLEIEEEDLEDLPEAGDPGKK